MGGLGAARNVRAEGLPEGPGTAAVGGPNAPPQQPRPQEGGETFNPFPPSVPIWHRLVKLSFKKGSSKKFPMSVETISW